MWISGFEAGLFAAQHAAGMNMSVCLPEGITGEQAILIIEKFMKENPKILNMGADVVAHFALWQAFPCPGSQKPN